MDENNTSFIKLDGNDLRDLKPFLIYTLIHHGGTTYYLEFHFVDYVLDATWDKR